MSGEVKTLAKVEMELLHTAIREAGRYTVATVLKVWSLLDSFCVCRAIPANCISSPWILEVMCCKVFR